MTPDLAASHAPLHAHDAHPQSGAGPRRIQLRRVKGYRKPPGAVVVIRPSRWGNPFRVVPVRNDAGRKSRWAVQETRETGSPGLRPGTYADRAAAHAAAVELYREWLDQRLADGESGLADDLSRLAGKAIACVCPPELPCHGDVILARANPGAAGPLNGHEEVRP